MTARKTTVRKTTVAAKKTTKFAAAKPVASKRTTRKATAVTEEKVERNFDTIDWTYLQDKDPSDLHVLFAKLIRQRADIDITPQQVKAVLSMHPYFQRSDHNKKRPTYRPLDAEIVHQRSVHMVAAHEDAHVAIAARDAKPARRTVAKKTTAKKAVAKKTTRKAS